MAPGETFWFVVYGIASLLYRLSILWFICVYVTEKYFSVGILLAFWLVVAQIIFPAYKAICFLAKNPSLTVRKIKMAMVTISLVIVALALLTFLPVTSFTMAEGVVWLPDEALIKAELDGFVGVLQVRPNQAVAKGDVVLLMTDDMLETKARVARAKMVELESKYRAEREANLVKADILKDELHVARAELEHLNRKIRSMTIKAAKSGRILLPEADDLPGRYLHHGELIGYILDDSPPTIRMVVTQDNIGQMRERLVGIKARLSNVLSDQYDATIIRQAPEATNRLPSAALATTGGGKLPIDPSDVNELTTLQKVFSIDLKFNPKDNRIPLGTRAYVRVNHGGEPLAIQWYRRIRQAFLRHFDA